MVGKVWWVLASAVVVLGVPSWAGAAHRVVRGAIGGDTNPDDNGHKKGSFIVIQSGDTDGKVTFEAVPPSELEVRQEGLATLYRAAVKKFTADKQDAKAKGEKFTDAPPEKPFVQRYKEETYYTLKIARRVAEECQKNWDKAFAAKQAAKDGDAKAPDGKAAVPPKEDKAPSGGKPAE